MMEKRIIFLVGPTATGKSEVAVALAKKTKGEIISCDSMQVYKGMKIMTSWPLRSLMEQVPHHLIGAISPEKEYNAALFRRDALKKIREIALRGKVPIFAGGTGLYLSVLLDGIFSVKAHDEKLRERLYGLARTRGSAYLFQRLEKADPAAAAKIHPNDTRRIVRGLEVFELTGKPISELQKQRTGLASSGHVRVFCLTMQRAKLYSRIDSRVEKMFSRGLAREIKKLCTLRLSKTAQGAIGLKELKAYFNGQCALEEAKAAMKKSTRNYAKRQLTWFRKDTRIKWIEVKEKETPQAVARRIAAILAKG